ncbi:dTDP-glucose 4,6-dehydratase [Massilia niastensis]|uniref:dTDP-glucose 4,6-dehydratase n=1 Tax=Massilia niastensis TaxID=544911 RepID=UPI00035F2DB0|nr:dTDP-glucose 4,6-dehydratase [Massilia niastensis]
MILVTGGAGFIGANFILDWLARSDEPVVNLDKLTYAGNPGNLAGLEGDARHLFVRGDIGDGALVAALLRQHRPRAILHFAAESHVDRSIHAPERFMATNVQGTFTLLEAARAHVATLGAGERAAFRFLHVSTDEVYGSLGPLDPPFTETTPYAPSSPYAASKAAADHLVRAYHHTYGLPTLTTNCSNNYGPFQFPEKLIPLMIANALAGKPLPVYGDGRQVRDWLHVGDHCSALRRVLEAGRPGQAYNLGGGGEMSNLELVGALCDILDRLAPGERSRRAQIAFVADRPGHDRRYAIDSGKARRELGWQPVHAFAAGLEDTAGWYLAHRDRVARVGSGAHLEWGERHDAQRGAAA